MQTLARIRGVVGSALVLVFTVFVLAWLWFYLDSLHERRRAEHLISGVKSFPVSTAAFPEVRDFVTRYGGTSVQQFQPLNPSTPGLPVEGHAEIPPLRTGPTCTAQDCAFEISVRPLLYRLWLAGGFGSVSSGLAHLGLRPWAVLVTLKVKDDRLWEIYTSVAQCTRVEFGSTENLLPLGYAVMCDSKANAVAKGRPTHEYDVGLMNNVTGLAGRLLAAHLAQPTPPPVQRAFDIHLGCFTRIMHECDGFSEIAPSAWADYQLQEQLK
jgi:hypothetical protein